MQPSKPSNAKAILVSSLLLLSLALLLPYSPTERIRFEEVSRARRRLEKRMFEERQQTGTSRLQNVGSLRRPSIELTHQDHRVHTFEGSNDIRVSSQNARQGIDQNPREGAIPLPAGPSIEAISPNEPRHSLLKEQVSLRQSPSRYGGSEHFSRPRFSSRLSSRAHRRARIPRKLREDRYLEELLEAEKKHHTDLHEAAMLLKAEQRRPGGPSAAARTRVRHEELLYGLIQKRLDEYGKSHVKEFDDTRRQSLMWNRPPRSIGCSCQKLLRIEQWQNYDGRHRHSGTGHWCRRSCDRRVQLQNLWSREAGSR